MVYMLIGDTKKLDTTNIRIEAPHNDYSSGSGGGIYGGGGSSPYGAPPNPYGAPPPAK